MRILRPRPQHVLVERRQQAHRLGRALGRQFVDVRRARPAGGALDVHRHDRPAGAQLREPPAQELLRRDPAQQPVVDRGLGRRSVDREVPLDDPRPGVPGVRQAGPGREVEVRAGEGHGPAHGAGLAQEALPGERLQHGAPARAQLLGERGVTGGLDDGRGELLPGQRSGGECLDGGVGQGGDLRRGEEGALPGPALPGAGGREQREDVGGVVDGQHVQGPPHRPGADELAGGQRRGERSRCGHRRPHRDRLLCRGHHLGLQADQPPRDADRRRALAAVQQLAALPPREHLAPRHRHARDPASDVRQ